MGKRGFKKCEYGDEAWLCHPDCPCRLLDEQSGELAHSSTSRRQRKGVKFSGKYNNGKPGVNPNITHSPHGYGDSGGASRFFKIIEND